MSSGICVGGSGPERGSLQGPRELLCAPRSWGWDAQATRAFPCLLTIRDRSDLKEI